MLKKIKIADLKKGMHIVNMDRSWINHPFLTRKKTITSDRQIAKLKEYGIDEVFIDTDRGLDVDDQPSSPSRLTEKKAVASDRQIKKINETLINEVHTHTDKGIDLGGQPSSPSRLTEKETITSNRQKSKLKEAGINEVYTDADTGLEVSGQPSLPFRDRSEKPYINKLGSKAENKTPTRVSIPGSVLKPEVPFREEIKKARVIQQKALTVVKDFMRDVRVGKNIEPARATNVVNAMIDSIFRNQEALFSLTRIKDYDDYTFVHSINVCVLSLAIGRQLNLSREELQELGVGALLHDLGKMRVPNKILNKPGKLTPQEYGEIKRHPEYGMEILERSRDISKRAKLISLQHHERHDGSGYPRGLQGEKIDRFSQLVAIVDVYDAMTSVRCYSNGVPPHESVKHIYKSSQKEFSKEMVDKFIEAVGIYPVGTLVQMDTGEVGIVFGINPKSLLRPRVIILYQNDRSQLETPVEIDLLEKSSSPQSYKRSILKSLDPQKWDINVKQFLANAM